jgi:hypothetical protein
VESLNTPPLTSTLVDELTALWIRLTDELDFRAGEWFARDERGDWLHVSSLHIHDLLFSLGVGESSVDWDNVERKRIIRQFKDRDRETTHKPRRDFPDVRVTHFFHRELSEWRVIEGRNEHFD